MGFATFLLSKTSKASQPESPPEPVHHPTPITTITTTDEEEVEPEKKRVVSLENSVLRVDFDSTTGLVQRITNKKLGKTTELTQSFFQYTSNTTPLMKEGTAPQHTHNKPHAWTKEEAIAAAKERIGAPFVDVAGGAYVFHPLGNATELVDKPVSWELIQVM